MNFNNIKFFQNTTTTLLSKRCLSSCTTSITKVRRPVYVRSFPTTLVLPNGSTIQMRYVDPRMIIKLPLDINTLNDNDKRLRLELRKPRQKLETREEEKVTFDASKYLKKMVKKK